MQEEVVEEAPTGEAGLSEAEPPGGADLNRLHFQLSDNIFREFYCLFIFMKDSQQMFTNLKSLFDWSVSSQ